MKNTHEQLLAALRASADAHWRIVAAYGARILLSEDIRIESVRAKLEAQALTNDGINSVAISAFEACVRALAAAGDPTATIHECNPSETPPVTKSCYCCTCRSEEYGSDDPYCRNHGHAGVRQCVKHGSTDAKQGVDEDGKAIATCQQVWEAKSWSTADKLLTSPSSPPGESQRGEGE